MSEPIIRPRTSIQERREAAGLARLRSVLGARSGHRNLAISIERTGVSNQVGEQKLVPSLDGCVAKVERAKEHIEVLRPELRSVDHAVTFERRLQVNESQELVRLALHVVATPGIDPRWSTVIGDIVHCLRSALDYLVYELIGLTNCGAYWEDSQFPIADDPRKLSWRDKGTFDRLGRFRELIEACQPYSGQRAFASLAILRDLANQDKHRLLVPTFIAPATDTSHPLPQPISDCELVRADYLAPGRPLVPGAVAAAVIVRRTGDNVQVTLPYHYSPKIVLAEYGSVEDLLDLLSGTVQAVIAPFEVAFQRESS